MPETPNPKLREAPSPTKSAIASSLPYAELNVKSNFSFLAGASHPDELVYRAAELGYRAIAITDFNSLAGVVRAHEAAKESGIHLLIGSRLRFADASDLLVWAPDRAAYARLCRLLTLGKSRAVKGECLLVLQDFIDESDGLLAAIIPPEIAEAAKREENSCSLPRYSGGGLGRGLGRRLSPSPLPNPPPEYRGRGPDPKQSEKKSPISIPLRVSFASLRLCGFMDSNSQISFSSKAY